VSPCFLQQDLIVLRDLRALRGANASFRLAGESPDAKLPGVKIIRFEDKGSNIHYGRLLDDGQASVLEGDPANGFHDTGLVCPVGKLLAPLLPTTLLCIGLNYRLHAEETGAKLPEFPILFMKPPGAVQNPGDPILLPRHLRSDEVDYEVELAIVIGKTCKNATRENALDYVLGYTCANDVSARDWQKNGGGGQWCRGKGFDTFCPLGPWIVTRDEIPDPNALHLQTRVNGETLQDSSTADMIFDVPALITFLSGSTTLFPGTVILTGTPSGVGMSRKPPRWLQSGDKVEVEIEKIGILNNPVQDEEPGN
jgi:2-keto-4-pentenoate hydratase/2-oxohepta-3-ene-1,7-dioic acid hydratase in catechol pathway